MTVKARLEERLVSLLEQEPDWKKVARDFESRLLDENSSIWLPNDCTEPWKWSFQAIEILCRFDDWKARFDYAASHIEHFINAEELLLSLLPRQCTLD
jgi:hypothetical protein